MLGILWKGVNQEMFWRFWASQMGFDEKKKKEKLAILIYGEMVGIDCVWDFCFKWVRIEESGLSVSLLATLHGMVALLAAA